jgi:hypothetical protein
MATSNGGGVALTGAEPLVHQQGPAGSGILTPGGQQWLATARSCGFCPPAANCACWPAGRRMQQPQYVRCQPVKTFNLGLAYRSLRQFLSTARQAWTPSPAPSLSMIESDD